ncbi:HAD family hydrolase [Gymnodinialimonas hymeniacidonis]|uniref:HAD family hydrolase n=1 Tax=Gymnodinialimonas hymeniacidonis TaxID=3126508 RepID=UPI0034C620AA
MPQPKALFFGAIGTLVETSDMQRRAFNAAFNHLSLGWSWGREAYREMLHAPGGKSRIEAYAEAQGQDVDVDEIYRAKVAYFREFARDGLEPRPGVLDVIERAQSKGVALGFATTTGTQTVDLIFEGLKGVITRDMFGFVGDRDFVSASKPSPEIYRLGLAHFGISAGQAVAIEDTPESAQSSLAAGIETLAFPGEAARGRSFPSGITHVLDRLEPSFCGLGLSAA